MAISLVNAKKLSQDKLTDQIIDEFRTSPLLDALQFDNTVKPQGGRSLSYVYNRITTQPTANGRAINSEYNAQEAATTQYTVNLAPIGGSYKIDRVIAEDEVQLAAVFTKMSSHFPSGSQARLPRGSIPLQVS